MTTPDAKLLITQFAEYTVINDTYTITRDGNRYVVSIAGYDACKDRAKHDKNIDAYYKADKAWKSDKIGKAPVRPKMVQTATKTVQINLRDLASVKSYLVQLHQWLVYDPECERDGGFEFVVSLASGEVLHLNSYDMLRGSKNNLFEDRKHLEDTVDRFCNVFDALQ